MTAADLAQFVLCGQVQGIPQLWDNMPVCVVHNKSIIVILTVEELSHMSRWLNMVSVEQRPLVQAGWQQLGQVGQKLCVGWQAKQAEWNPFWMRACGVQGIPECCAGGRHKSQIDLPWSQSSQLFLWWSDGQ